MYTKAANRLYYIIMLRRSGVSKKDLVELYCYLVRPVLEYACQVWHPGLNQQERKLIESVQKRALHIIYPELTYDDALKEAAITTLEERRNNLCLELFDQLQNPFQK